MKSKWFVRAGAVFMSLIGIILPQISLAFSIVPDKCIQSKIGCDACDIILIFTNVSSIIAGFLSGTALLNFIIGGLFLILANGNEQHIETGKKIVQATIVGLVVVMFAWIGVNFVVRLAYKANTGSDANVTLFGKEWWAPTCTSSVKSCTNAIVGDACGFGECSENNAAPCTCFRNLKNDGDFGKCGSQDLSSADAAAASYDGCYCTSQCSQFNYRSGYTSRKWSCQNRESAKKDSSLDTVTAAAVPCPKPTDICAGAKK